MTTSTLDSETILARGETSKRMAASEVRRSMEASPSALGEIDEDNHDKDLSMVPLLPPQLSVLDYPETSTSRNPEMEQEEQDDSRELRHLRATSSYTGSVADVVLRALAVMLSLIALVFTAVNWKGRLERTQSDFMNFFVSKYMLSVNVVVFLYSCAILSLTIFRSADRDTRGSNNLLFLLSIFQLDQTFAYLLISATLSAFDSSGNLTSSSSPPTKIGFFYERTLASALVSLLAFAALTTTFFSSGYRLVAKICKHSQNALETPFDDDCHSPTSKLLP